MNPVIVVHHHEITLKGGNRGFFERTLMANIRMVLADYASRMKIKGGYGRFVLEFTSVDNIEEIAQRLTTVFGLANICTGLKVAQDIDVFCSIAEEMLRGRQFNTIKVDTRRPDKNFPLNSVEVNVKVGGYLCDTFNVRANLSKPDETIYIEIVDKYAYVYRSKLQGAAGLPVGASGKVVSLLSAGFDSPVASWRMLRRGCSVMYVHFHSMPYTSQHALNQVRELVTILTRYQYHSKLFIVPFAEVQNELVLQTPQHLRVIFYRRFMVRVAEAIARKRKAEALVTGEAVGQVASQTLRNIRVIDDVATLPILRPLAGMDKEETMATARLIGTHDISNEPYDDCCSFLAPRHPATRATLKEVAEAESKVNVQQLVDMALQQVTSEEFMLPQWKERLAKRAGVKVVEG